MRFDITVFLTLTLILAVNAAAVLKSKRDVAANVQSCTNNINIFATQIDALLENIQAKTVFTNGRSYDDHLEDIMDATETSCCGIHAVISDADADFFLASVGNVTPKIQNILSVLTEKQGGYNYWTKFIVKGQLRSLDSYTNQLTSCFATFSPETKKSTLQSYISQWKSALETTKASYDADVWFKR